MFQARKLSESEVRDGGIGGMIMKGSMVDLLPIDPENYDGEEGKFLSHQRYEFLKRWLGEGPYSISWIGQWPCGRLMLYLSIPGREPGVHAEDLRCCE